MVNALLMPKNAYLYMIVVWTLKMEICIDVAMEHADRNQVIVLSNTIYVLHISLSCAKMVCVQQAAKIA